MGQTRVVQNDKHFALVTSSFSEAFVTGKFCDVKVVCQDSNLWAHRLVLCSVSPFLRSLLVEFERRGDDVITIFLPLIKGYHMKLVLDYIYSGAMYLCGAHMQYVVQVMEVLQLKCGVSVSKMVLTQEDAEDQQWVEVEHSVMRLNNFAAKTEDGGCKPEEGPVKEEKAEADSEASKGKAGGRQTPVDRSLDTSADPNDEMVVVELDEEFVVEKMKAASGDEVDTSKDEDVKGHKCVLCGRFFKHYNNLQIHLKGHVGVKVNLHRCPICKRNFRNKTELGLHERSHGYARFLGKKKAASRAAAEAAGMPGRKILTTSGTKDKKILRKYVKGCKPCFVTCRKVAMQPPSSPSLPPPSSPAKTNSAPSPHPRAGSSTLTCNLCEKSFGVRSIYERHMRQKHPDWSSPSPAAGSPASSVGSGSEPLSPKGRRRRLPQAAASSPAVSAGGGRKRKLPSRFSNSDGHSSPDKRRNSVGPLQCPDCERVFPLKSILERHLQKSKHGEYSLYSSDSGPASPTISFRGKQVTKYECHLCNQVFLRVKDLAKHREKVCAAWLNPSAADV